MTIDLGAAKPGGAQGWAALGAATAALDPPFAVLDLDALAANAADLVRRAGGVPIRVASKSIRSRAVLEAILAQPGLAGVLAYTLPEALWLAAGSRGLEDIVVAYPTADREAIGRLGAHPGLAARVAIMVDSVEQLDFVDAVVPPEDRLPIRVAIDLDASWRFPFGGERGMYVGVRRSTIRSPEDAAGLARAIVGRPGFRLVGAMSYEAQIAGVADRPDGRPFYGRVLTWMHGRSVSELLERRIAIVDAIRAVAPLEFVNGGGTGSVEFTAKDAAITDIAAGSGFYGPRLFDQYTRFDVQPAAAFCLSVVRKPAPDIAVVLGGGWIASGPAGPDRSPTPVHPAGLAFTGFEGAGEVQTPLVGDASRELRVGDRVWFRHTKAGELSEHVNELVVVSGGEIVGRVPTYRGEGKAWL